MEEGGEPRPSYKIDISPGGRESTGFPRGAMRDLHKPEKVSNELRLPCARETPPLIPLFEMLLRKLKRSNTVFRIDYFL